MAARSKRDRLQEWLRGHGVAYVEPSHFSELLEMLKPVAEPALRRLLRGSGVPLHPLVEGVSQDDFPSLGRTLTSLAELYEAGGQDTRRSIRRIVITAKEHAKLAARNARVAPEAREKKAAMVEWMLVWLENPGVFPVWAETRQRLLKLD